MRSIALLLLLSLATISGCGQKDIVGKEVKGAVEGEYRGYIPVEPIPVKAVTYFDSIGDTCAQTAWANLSSKARLDLLPLQTAEVSVKKFDATVGAKFLASSASVGYGNYEVVMDYMKYLVDTVVDSSNRLIGSRRIGVGLRMTARVSTLAAGMNISGLGPLAAEASMNRLSGSLSVNVIGIDSRDVTNLIPITSQLDQTSIQAALQALAAVKTKMWDTDETTITPHVVAVQQRKDNSIDNILQKESHSFVRTKLGDCLMTWWMPGGIADSAKTDTLVQWLQRNRQHGAPEAIMNLIRGDDLEIWRAKAVKYLGLTCDPSPETSAGAPASADEVPDNQTPSTGETEDSNM